MIRIRYLMWNYPHINVTGPYWWWVNICSGNGLMPSSNMPSPETTTCWSSPNRPISKKLGLKTMLLISFRYTYASWPNWKQTIGGIHHWEDEKVRISDIFHERIDANLNAGVSTRICIELVGAKFKRNQQFFHWFSALLAWPKSFLYGSNWDPMP